MGDGAVFEMADAICGAGKPDRISADSTNVKMTVDIDFFTFDLHR